MSAAAFHAPRLDAGLAVLAAETDVILCDVWGVIHNGVAHHASAVDALRRFRHGGGTVILVTNAPVPAERVRARLDSLGVGRDAYDAVATAGDVAAALIVAAGCPPVFTIGPAHDVAIYAEAGRIGPRTPPRAGIAEAAMAVCLGLDGVRALPADYDDDLARLKARGLDLVCANPDIVVEVGDDLVWCAGAIAARYAAMGGTVIQAGKPFPAIYERALALAAAVRGPVTARRVLAIGDAVATDLAGAARQGVAALFITAGIHRAELHGADGALDAAALTRLLADAGATPGAALPRLSWDHAAS